MFKLALVFVAVLSLCESFDHGFSNQRRKSNRMGYGMGLNPISLLEAMSADAYGSDHYSSEIHIEDDDHYSPPVTRKYGKGKSYRRPKYSDDDSYDHKMPKIYTKKSIEVKPMSSKGYGKHYDIKVPSGDSPVKVMFHTEPTSVHVQQKHRKGKGEYKKTTSHEEPHVVVHEVIKPVIQEIREVILPYRKVVQKIEAVKEERKTIVHKKDGKDDDDDDEDDHKKYKKQSKYSKKEDDDEDDKKYSRKYHKEDDDDEDDKKYKKQSKYSKKDDDDDQDDRKYKKDDDSDDKEYKYVKYEKDDDKDDDEDDDEKYHHRYHSKKYDEDDDDDKKYESKKYSKDETKYDRQGYPYQSYEQQPVYGSEPAQYNEEYNNNKNQAMGHLTTQAKGLISSLTGLTSMNGAMNNGMTLASIYGGEEAVAPKVQTKSSIRDSPKGSADNPYVI